jgi:hypothetical protein
VPITGNDWLAGSGRIEKQWLNIIIGDPLAESEIYMLINRRILKIMVI